MILVCDNSLFLCGMHQQPVLKNEVFNALQMGVGTSKNISRKTTIQNIILMCKCSHHLKCWINSTLQVLFIISTCDEVPTTYQFVYHIQYKLYPTTTWTARIMTYRDRRLRIGRPTLQGLWGRSYRFRYQPVRTTTCDDLARYEKSDFQATL